MRHGCNIHDGHRLGYLSLDVYQGVTKNTPVCLTHPHECQWLGRLPDTMPEKVHQIVLNIIGLKPFLSLDSPI